MNSFPKINTHTVTNYCLGTTKEATLDLVVLKAKLG